jgi:arylsulfatase A-like enzyme
LVAASTAVETAPESGATSSRRPHLLFVIADQHRHDAMSGGLVGAGATPALDGLREEGVTFALHYTSTPSCTPARAAILTGRSPWRHGMLGFGDIALRYECAELPKVLARAGYATASVGKNHFYNVASGGTNPSHGFDVRYTYDGIAAEFDTYDAWFNVSSNASDPLATGTTEFGDDLAFDDYRGAPYMYAERLHPTAWVGATARAVLRRHVATETGRPLFLKTSFHRPHSPYDPPARLLDKFQALAVADAATATDGWDAAFAAGRNYSGLPYGSAPVGLFCGDLGASAVARTRRAYLSSVAFVDEHLGLLLDDVEALGLGNDTLVLYTADHGDQQGDHYLWRKGFPFEGSAHVPLILRWPGGGLARGLAVAAKVTEHRDLLPTFLDAARASATLTAAEAPDGRSLLALARGGAGEDWRAFVDLEHDPGTLGPVCFTNTTNHWNALTDGFRKYVFNAHDLTEYLFDLRSDPREETNLAAAVPDVLALWRARLVAHFEREGRGAAWVEGGVLQRRTFSTLYSPHYPPDSPR